MQHDSYVFSAVESAAFSKRKRMQMLYVAGFVVSVLLVILSIIDGNKFKIFIFSILLVSNGISLLSPINKKPVTLEMDHAGLKLNNAESDKYLDWIDIKMARYNGRYLDLYWGSSFLKSIDLQMFPEHDQLEIVQLAGKYLAVHNVFIRANQIAGSPVA